MAGMLGERILIIGPSGSGKSTLAITLSGLTGLPVIHLDKEFWQPGWVLPNGIEWQITVPY